ncbi:MAG: cytidylate kinase-like family protein [Gemmatimonadetes bacterium]|jgi:cytidylate kinase|nr:cytidylate kinase-like family protein [Gemmatimonadota bacterium]MBK7833427.1 cytidylate kinase-like family protein [Gemmatimonadota bacterium]MBK8646383.1 cytidylate kinase-like family protein [Gemmatimonadota bacterium]
MPLITVSRMFGSGGSEVAAALSRRLQWALLDNAFIERVAVGLHITPAHVQAIEERRPSLAERIADAFAYSSQEMLSAPLGAPLPPTEERILEVTHRVIDEAVARGPVVLVGRGAQAWLASRHDAVHVLCVAPRDACITRVADREQLSPVQAARLVDETNRERQAYVRRHWRREWLDAAHYHVCVNTAWLGIAGAVDLVEAVVRARLAGEPA